MVSGSSPLHFAARAGNAQIINVLLNAGANIEAKNKDGNTPLLSAVSKEQKDSIRALVAKSADIEARNLIGVSPLSWAVNRSRIDILSILHNAEFHPAATSEVILHDYFEKIFSPCRDQLPKDLNWLKAMRKKLDGGKDPFEALRALFAQSGQISSTEMKKALQILQKNSPSLPTPDACLQCLIKHSPLFAKAWELVNREEQVKIHELDWSYSSFNAPAFYNSLNHAIHIHNSCNPFERVFCIVFETMNALQNGPYRKIDQLAREGMINREEFALLQEYVESETVLWTHRIFGLSDQISFMEIWKIANFPMQQSVGQSVRPLQVHADEYRKRWDLAYGLPYLKKHPECQKNYHF